MSMEKRRRLSRIAVVLALLALAAMCARLWMQRSDALPVLETEPVSADYARDVLRGEV